MNIAVIFAGGTGQRMSSSSVPKQFLELEGKPIIVYTLERFQNNQQIDKIVISCLEGWIEHMQMLVECNGLDKVHSIVPGGETGQLSIFNALESAGTSFPDNSIVLVHDGVRPLIDDKTINDAIECVRKNGSAITVVSAIETVVLIGETNKIESIVDRTKCKYARAPQCFILGELLKAHRKAQEESIYSFVDSAGIMKHYGHKLYAVEGRPENIKITTPSDYFVFKAYVEAESDSLQIGD